MTQIEPLIDNRGNLIEVGSKVCYNLSGEIAFGIVQSVTPGERDGWRYTKKAMIKVKVLFPKNKAGDISKVRFPRNVMVVNDTL